MEDACGEGDFVTGSFSVKCYPFPHQGVFGSFSAEEQDLVQSNFFDHTNTPRFEHLHLIPQNFYNVGVIEYTLDSKDGLALFTFEAPDVMRIRYEQETVQQYVLLQKSKRFQRDEVGRNVPAWKVGYPFFDRVISLYAYYSRIKPTRVVMTRSPGFEYVYTESNRFECSDSEEVWTKALAVLFASDGKATDARGDGLISEHLTDVGQEVIFDRAFRCGHHHDEHNQSPSMPILNDQWWSMADSNYRSELTTLCGCE
jgi:hypothetical protein